MQHCWPTTPNIVGCYMLGPFAHPVSCCWMLLRLVAQSLKPAKLFSQRLPTFLLFRDPRSVAQQCWICLHSSSNIVGATYAHYAWLQRLMGCILPTMHCRCQHCLELLHLFAHHCQHARRLFASRLMEKMLYAWVPVHLFFSLPHIFTLVAASFSFSHLRYDILSVSSSLYKDVAFLKNSFR